MPFVARYGIDGLYPITKGIDLPGDSRAPHSGVIA
jgi:hypothetical protein